MKRSPLLFIPLVAFAGCHHDEPEKKPVVDVKVERSVLADVPLLVTAPAAIYGKSEARIAARITAPVQRLLAHKGDAVRKGQLLAVLDSSDLRAQTSDAAATLANSQANLQRTQSGSIPTDLSQARADLDAKAAAYNLAQKVYSRRKELLDQGAITGREVQVSQADEIQARANYDAAKTRLDLLAHQTSGNDLKIAQSMVAQAEARQQLAAANLNFTELRSPMDATVTEQTMYPGDMAKPDVPMFTLIDLSSAVARAQVDADQSSSVLVGQSCRFEQKGDVASSPTPHMGKITVVNQAVDPARRTVEVWCEIPNHDHALKAGLFGSVRIAVGNARGAVVISSSAIEFEEGTGKGKIDTVDAQHIAHLRNVQAVALDDDRVRILAGLGPGEVVITEGEYGLPDGTAVNPKEARQ